MFLTRYNRNGSDNPFALMNEMRRELDRLFVDSPFNMAAGSARSPRATLNEEDNRFVLRLEVPGLTADNLEVKVEDGVLRLAGERNETALEGFEARRTERVRYRFDRSLALPKDVQADKIEAVLKDGLLTVTVPKAEKAAPRTIDVRAS